MQKKHVRVIAIILAAIMACSVFVGALATVARAASVSDLKEKRKEIEQRIQEVEAKLDSLEEEHATTLDRKEKIDEQIDIIQKLIDNIAEQIEVYDGLIAEKQKEVEAAQKKEDEQYDLYKNRIRTMEENGTISYYEIIFGATSFTDLLAELDIEDTDIDDIDLTSDESAEVTAILDNLDAILTEVEEEATESAIATESDTTPDGESAETFDF